MYIKRNQEGEVIALSQTPLEGMSEQLDDDAPEVHQFLKNKMSQRMLTLEQSDQAMARVLEDLINVLVDKGTIRFTDLPDAAQLKLLSRRELRGQRQGMNLLEDEDDFKI